MTLTAATYTGHPEIDLVIEEFLAEPLGDWTADDGPISSSQYGYDECPKVTW